MRGPVASPAVEPCVLVVDDDLGIHRTLERILGRLGAAAECHATAEAGLAALAAGDERFELLLTDLHLPAMDGLELLGRVRQEHPTVPVILMTGMATIDVAVEAMRRGAHDFVVKPFDSVAAVSAAIERARAHGRLVRRNRYLEQRLDVAERFEGIVGSSPVLRAALVLVDSVAPTDATVLVLGESGTGKEAIARALHERSLRASGAFVAVNCGALAESLAESELFGHAKGAFTGAVAARRGLFEAAAGGTLFLDEVGELSPAMQARLLRVLQERELRPVGSTETVKIDVRVVSATHRDLRAEVARGSFREDLYYRLAVFTVTVPPLRERRSDVPALVAHFLRKHSARLGRPVPSVAPAALERLGREPWPGNVRQLENVVHRAVIVCRGESLGVEHLLLDAAESAGAAPVEVAETPPSSSGGVPSFADARSAFEGEYVERVLAATEGNVAEAARLAGMDRSNFRRLLKRHRR